MASRCLLANIVVSTLMTQISELLPLVGETCTHDSLGVAVQLPGTETRTSRVPPTASIWISFSSKVKPGVFSLSSEQEAPIRSAIMLRIYFAFIYLYLLSYQYLGTTASQPRTSCPGSNRKLAKPAVMYGQAVVRSIEIFGLSVNSTPKRILSRV